MKRILIVFLTLLLILPAVPAFAQTAEETDPDAKLEEYQPYVDFALALDLMGYGANGKFAPEAPATRGDLGTVIGRMLGRAKSGGATGIPDVSGQTTAGAYIAAAVHGGYMQLYTDGNFHSSEQITVKDTLGAMVSLLGYGSKALDSEDASFRMTASRLGIDGAINGLGDTEPISRGALAELVYQTVHTEPLLVRGIELASPRSYETLQPAGKPYLEACMDIGAIHGVIEASAYTYLREDLELESGQVLLDGNIYADTSFYASNYVGYDAAVYYDDSDAAAGSREIFFAAPYRTRNKTLTVKAADLEFSSGTSEIRYAEDGRVRTARLSSDAVYVYNGKPLSAGELNKDRLSVQSGSITLISNTGDSSYNVALIYDEKNYLVSNVNATRGEINCQKNYAEGQDINQDTLIEADAASGDYQVSFLKDGAHTTIDELEKNSVISVAASLDGKLVRIVISEAQAEGIISRVESNDRPTVWLGEAKYTADPQCPKEKLKPGNYVTAYLNAQGEIVFVSTATSANQQYGYLIETASASVFKDTWQFRIFALETVPASVIKVESASKIVLNGKSEKNTGEVVDFLQNQKKNPANANEGLLIKFRLDGDGRLKYIDTAEDVTASPYVDESKFLKQADTEIYRRLGQLGPFYIDTNQTLYVHIPSVKSMTDTDYRVGAAPGDNAVHTCVVYDVQPNMIPKVVILPNSDPGAGVPGSKAAFTVVDSVNRGLDEDGDEVYMLECYQNKKLVSFIFGDSVLKQDDNTADGFPATISTNGANTILGGKLWPWELKCGDVIQFNTDHLGRIGSYKVLIRHDCMEDLAALGTTYREEVNGNAAKPVYNEKNSHLGDSRAYLGYTHVVDIVDGRMIFNPFKELGYPMVGNKSISYSGKAVYIYNRTNGTLRVGTSDDVYPGANIFFRDYNAGVKFDIVVVED